MRRAHTTTKNPITYLRLIVIAAASALFVWAIPAVDAGYESLFTTHSYNLGLISAVIVGFLMSISLTRNQQVEEHISIELNKIRRIYHLAYHLAQAEPRLQPWFSEVKAGVIKYLGYFRTHNFRQYEESNGLFRDLSYTVYGLPQKGIPYESSLYASLLDATSEATVAREQIQAKKDYRIGRYQWFVLLLVSFSFCAVMTLNTPTEPLARAATAIVVFCFLLALDLLFEYDFSNPKKFRLIANQYAENIDKLTIAKKKGKR